MPTLQDVIGLFGTVGESTWRDGVIARLQREGIAYFNPLAPDWTPERAEIEAQHLATDRVLLFMITGEWESYGSLAETGWAALSAAKNGQTAVFVIQDFHGSLWSAANRARALVRAHAEKAGVVIYEDVDTAVSAAIQALRGT